MSTQLITLDLKPEESQWKALADVATSNSTLQISKFTDQTHFAKRNFFNTLKEFGGDVHTALSNSPCELSREAFAKLGQDSKDYWSQNQYDPKFDESTVLDKVSVLGTALKSLRTSMDWFHGKSEDATQVGKRLHLLMAGQSIGMLGELEGIESAKALITDFDKLWKEEWYSCRTTERASESARQAPTQPSTLGAIREQLPDTIATLVALSAGVLTVLVLGRHRN